MERTIYFVGIAGTGMASAAGLCKEAGYNVLGSDAAVYPPMSTMLKENEIFFATPYDASNVETHKADTYIIGNAISKQHVEVQKILEKQASYTSFPAFIGSRILSKRKPVVITGTHGKTTTSSLTAHLLQSLNLHPGYLIGGMPLNFERSYSIGKGPFFVIEGDEYDTAFFDKESKFLHYKPFVASINNIEFDHADIFKDLDSIYKMFEKLILTINPRGFLVVNQDDPGVKHMLSLKHLINQERIVTVSTKDADTHAHVALVDARCVNSQWIGTYQTKLWGALTIESPLLGGFNLVNMAQVLGIITALVLANECPKPSVDDLKAGLKSFKGVRRRLEPLVKTDKVVVYEDFAHHPTAVKEVLQVLKATYPNRRVIVAFEPKNATSRRNTFHKAYVEAFSLADQLLLGVCPVDARIAEGERMDTKQLAKDVGIHKAQSFEDHQDLLAWLKSNQKDQDVVVFMTSGDFSGVHRSFKDHLLSF